MSSLPLPNDIIIFMFSVAAFAATQLVAPFPEILAFDIYGFTIFLYDCKKKAYQRKVRA